jgi:hypothetical protein
MLPGMDATTLILIIGATARLTRLVTTDKIFEVPREALLDRINPTGLLTYMLGCRWCVSIYTGAATTIYATITAGNVWCLAPLAMLTASQATGLLAAMEE